MSTIAQTVPGITGTGVFELITQTNDQNFAFGGVVPNIGSQANDRFGINRIARFFQKASVGAWNSNTLVKSRMQYATGTIQLNGVTNLKTVGVAGLTFTGLTVVASTIPGTTSFALGGTDTFAATNFVNAINTYQPSAQLVGATLIGTNIAGIWSVVPGVIGNLISVQSGITNFILSGATLTGGTEFRTGVAAHGL